MDIKEYVSKFQNYPVLFTGTGISLRYLKKSYTWEELLEFISTDLSNNIEDFYDLQAKYSIDNQIKYDKIASVLEKKFNDVASHDRYGKYKEINDEFYESMKQKKVISRFKLFVASLLSDTNLKPERKEELILLKNAKKNISSVITTNYDNFIEEFLEFQPLIGNDILFSNPYGSVYKIHGSVTDPNQIIITDDDYKNFQTKYELIRAQLVSLFIHHPIIFIGYKIGDDNIKDILKTIFSYVDINSEQANKIRENFLLIEYEKDSDNVEISDYDIQLEINNIIRIKKLKTDNYSEIYQCLADLNLAISTMDIRKVQSIVKEIYNNPTEGSVNVIITEDIDNLKNNEKIWV